MKKISTLFFFFCCIFTAFAQDQEELDHAKFLKQTNQANEDRGGKFKYDSIYRTDKTSFTATPFLARKDFYTYNKDGKRLTSSYKNSTDGKIFRDVSKSDYAYYPNGNLKVDSSFSWDSATQTWINSSKYKYLTYDANGFNTYYESESWNKTSKVWGKSSKTESVKNKTGAEIKYLYYGYSSSDSKYLLSGLDSATVLDNANNPLEKKYYNITWSGSTPTITPFLWVKSKFDANGNNTGIINHAWDKTSNKYIKSDSSIRFFNAKNLFLGGNYFSWDTSSSKWILYSKTTYQVDPATELYSSYKLENWDATQNAFYDRTIRKYFVSMLPNVSTTDAALQSSFQIAPNPTSSDLHLMVNLEKISDIQVNVVNQLGQIVHNQYFKNIQNEQLTIPTQELSNGIYFIQIQSGDKQATKRFVKQ